MQSQVFAPHTALLHGSIDAQHQSLRSCACLLHQCCSVRQEEKSLAVSAANLNSFCTSHSSAALQHRCKHQSLGPFSRTMHQCCSVRQDDKSLAVSAANLYSFCTSHSSAALQHRCPAPKPGTLFTHKPTTLCTPFTKSLVASAETPTKFCA